jgi:hypothetical protein
MTFVSIHTHVSEHWTVNRPRSRGWFTWISEIKLYYKQVGTLIVISIE